jgi:hypothetical protein
MVREKERIRCTELTDKRTAAAELKKKERPLSTFR